ncbi:MAG: carboxypeptidase-like regulatory domain-containing protein [Nitrososphaera sp.]
MKYNVIRILVMVLLFASLTPLLYLKDQGTVEQAEAVCFTVSGTVTSPGGGPIGGAKVYFEAPATIGGDSPFALALVATTASGTGFYSKCIAGGETYNVQASSPLFNRKEFATTVSSARSDVNFVLSSQTTRTLNLFITADEEYRALYTNWQSTVWNKIVQRELGWYQQWNLLFDDTYYGQAAHNTLWTSPASTSCGTLHADLASDVNWPGNKRGADEIIAFTRIALEPIPKIAT